MNGDWESQKISPVLNIDNHDIEPAEMQAIEATPSGGGIPAGKVVSLWRYPVKSMMGEELNASGVSELGLAGDRAYAIIDKVSGKVASAKNPRKWGKLFQFRASFVGTPLLGGKVPPVGITLPDGRIVTYGDPNTDIVLSKELGAQVNLAASLSEGLSYEEYWPDLEGLANRDRVTEEAMPARTFFDAAPIHLLTTSTLDKFRRLQPESRFEARRFRPNIIIEPDSATNDFVEGTWVHKILQLGDKVKLRVTSLCTRCVMTTLAQGDLPVDLGILRAAARYSKVNVGAYASVEHGGEIKRGDAVSVE